MMFLLALTFAGFTAGDIDMLARDWAARSAPGAVPVPVDARVTYPPCGTTLNIDTVAGGLRIACPESWHVNVRLTGVREKATVPQEARHLVAARAIARGETIGAADIEAVRGRWHPTYMDDAAVLIGRQAARTIRPGQPIRFHMIEAATVVRRRDPVDIVASGPGFHVSMGG
ncbi:MAG: flagellar basal body P-ring formation chaperone FlgA, partial [Pseudomonadota bacterium]